MRIWAFTFVLLFSIAFSEEEDFFLDFQESSLFRDLEIVHEVDQRINEELPFLWNYQMQGGYFAMPSARMQKAGSVGFGFAYMAPYKVYSLVFQYFDHLELSGNYWIWSGITDCVLGEEFGDFADRAANVKFGLLRREDGIPFLPEISFGINDFIGTCRFISYYVVATQQFIDYNLELSVGWGSNRINGFFAGLAWSPFRKFKYIKDFTFAVEYDANDYTKNVHEHRDGRKVNFRINAGFHYRFLNIFHVAVSSIRGRDVAASASIDYNFGETKGFFPKIFDPLPYKAPVNLEPVGLLRTEKELASELCRAFKEQGFDLYTVVLSTNEKSEDILWLKVVNVRYREEEVVRERIQHLLASLLPSNIASVQVVIEASGIASQQYDYNQKELRRYYEGKLSNLEFEVISPMREVSAYPNKYDSVTLYKRSKPIWMWSFRPRFRSYFGSAKGKFKYDVGLITGPEGYLFDQIYYNITMSYTIKSSMFDVGDFDLLNPSKIINVRSDAIRYHQSNSFHVDQAFLQKSSNWGKGYFSRIAVGYFETAYAGVAVEALYYPVWANWAIGAEFATVLKRSYHGLGFQKVRKLCPITYEDFVGIQYFLDFHYQYQPLNLDFTASLGQFLAKDKGIRMEMGRTFSSGLRVGVWYTFTNGNDSVNRKRYYDKGFSFTMPLDLFMNKSSRTRIGYAMSAWLRDVGARASTGVPLYPTLYFERYNPNPLFH